MSTTKLVVKKGNQYTYKIEAESGSTKNHGISIGNRLIYTERIDEYEC